jgi:hypothetical protein
LSSFYILANLSEGGVMFSEGDVMLIVIGEQSFETTLARKQIAVGKITLYQSRSGATWYVRLPPEGKPTGSRWEVVGTPATWIMDHWASIESESRIYLISELSLPID